jgi:hypothetical protein
VLGLEVAVIFVVVDAAVEMQERRKFGVVFSMVVPTMLLWRRLFGPGLSEILPVQILLAVVVRRVPAFRLGPPKDLA